MPVFAPQTAAIQAFRDRGLYVGSQYDVVVDTIWDSVEYQAGDQFNRHNSELFSRGWDGCRSIVDTNVDMQRRLPPTESFLIRRVMFSFSRASADEDIYRIAESVVWHLWLGNKYFQRCHMIAMQQTECGRAPFRVCDYCHAVYVSHPTCPGCGAREFQIAESVGEPVTVPGFTQV